MSDDFSYCTDCNQRLVVRVRGTVDCACLRWWLGQTLPEAWALFDGEPITREALEEMVKAGAAR